MADLQSRIAALPAEKRALLERRLAEMATARGSAPADHIKPRDRSQPTPLAIPQEREWAVGRFRSANNIPGAFRVVGEIDPALLSQIFTEVTNRHEVLRSTVEIRDGGSLAQVVHPVTPVPVPVTDLTHLTPEQQREQVRRRWQAEVVGRFGPEQPQRLRVSLLRMAENNHVAFVTTDHAAADLASVALLIEEFAALYAIHANGGGQSLPPVEIQYGDFAAWQRELGHERMAAEHEFWRRSLDGIRDRLAVPSDRPFPARPTFAGDVHTMDLPAEFAADLRRFGDDEKVSVGVLLLAALAVLLQRYLEQDDLIIGELVSGRNRVETERLVGCFNNALPLRIRLDGEQTLREVVRNVRDVVLSSYDNQNLSVERLVGELDLGRDASLTSMTDVWLNVQTLPHSLEVPGLQVSQEPIDVTGTAAPLMLEADPGAETLDLRWVYMTEMFDTGTVALFAEQYHRVLRQLVTEADIPVGQVELAVAEQPSAATDPATEPDAADIGYVELFQRRVALTPYAAAVVYDGAATSYGDLNRDANRLAQGLRALGIGPEARVGILVDRSPRLACAMLAVLKAGGACLPLDPSYPPERIAFMLADAGTRVLITEERLATLLTGGGAVLPDQTVLLDGPPPGPGADTGQDLPELPRPTSLAYVVYTSGSTGRPKGTMIEHRSLARFARDIVSRLGLGAGDRFLQFASPGFDVLMEEMFPTWLAGGAVVIPAEHIISGGAELADLAERDRLTVMELPTAYWHEWVRELDRKGRALPPCLRLVIIGGERVLPERLTMWRRSGVPLMHVYGLTETTVSSTFFLLDPADPVADWPNLPIGTPLPSADLRILDGRLRRVPVGAIGELYIGGVSVARGYLGCPGLTAQRFVADPEPVWPGRRLYRTGDLVRQRPDGNLEFVSRVDTQIKIRGFRVEPTEIESALGTHPMIAASVVTLYEPSPGDRRLVAYIIPRPETAPSASDLRQHLEQQLPGYMVPSAFVELDALPLTQNGKVDRDRLPAPDGDRLDLGHEYVAPQTSQQQKLADIMASVVGVDRVGIHDNFFEVGGDSILAIQIVVRAQEAGLRLSPYDLFEYPTVAALAEAAAETLIIDAEQGPVSGPVPLVPAQRWFCTAGLEKPQHWNLSALLELPAASEPELVREAVARLLAHHDGLRQRFLLSGEKTRARIAPPGDVAPFEAHDLSGLDEAGQARRIAEIASGLQAGLDLAVGPLIRVALLVLGGRQPDRLAVVVHHMVADVPSVHILLEDLQTALAQLASGEQVALPAKTTSWQSWARRLGKYAATPPVQDQRGYWSELASTPVPRLPSDDIAEPAARTVATARTVTVSLASAETGGLLHAAPDALSCGVEDLLLAALARTLSQWSGESLHLVDLERHDRVPVFEDVDLTRTVGWFSRIHPVLLASEAGSPADKTLRAVKETLRGVPSSGMGWPLLHLGPEPLPDLRAELVFSYLGEAGRPTAGCPAAAAEPLGPDQDPGARLPYAIEVQAAVADGELEVRWRYSECTHTRETVEYLADCYLGELRVMHELSRSAHRPLYSPSDFPLARVDQAELDGLLSRL
jgi:amino acid adenylation domain-containing protein/non-ribosomal peptide synthase protein (TIGR01720 family)